MHLDSSLPRGAIGITQNINVYTTYPNETVVNIITLIERIRCVIGVSEQRSVDRAGGTMKRKRCRIYLISKTRIGHGSSSGKGNKCKCRTRRIHTENGCNYGGHRQKSLPDWVVLSKGQTMLAGYQYRKVQMNVGSTKRTHG